MFIYSLPLVYANPLQQSSDADNTVPIMSTTFSGKISGLLALMQKTLQGKNELGKRKAKNLRETLVELMSESCDTVCRLERRDEGTQQLCNTAKGQQSENCHMYYLSWFGHSSSSIYLKMYCSSVWQSGEETPEPIIQPKSNGKLVKHVLMKKETIPRGEIEQEK